MLVSTIFGISRFSFNLGYQIEQNPHVVEVIVERFTQSSTNFFTSIGRRVSGHLPLPNSGSSGADRHFALGVCTFVSTSVCAGAGVYMGYEAYLTRQISQRNLELAEIATKASINSAKAADLSAQANQQMADIKAVKHGLLSKEDYAKKYPGNIPQK